MTGLKFMIEAKESPASASFGAEALCQFLYQDARTPSDAASILVTYSLRAKHACLMALPSMNQDLLGVVDQGRPFLTERGTGGERLFDGRFDGIRLGCDLPVDVFRGAEIEMCFLH